MHHHQIRVRYAETDRMDVAHHASYIPWLEEARIEAMRACGISYKELEQRGAFMPVTELNIRYKRSVRFDDLVDLHTIVSPKGVCRVCFDTKMKHDGQLVAEATVTVATVDANGKPCRIPKDIVEQFDAQTGT